MRHQKMHHSIIMLPRCRNLFSQARFFHRKYQKPKYNKAGYKHGKALMKSAAIFGPSSLFLWYNTVTDQLTGRKKLNILSEENRERAASILLQTISSCSSDIINPGQWSNYKGQSAKEKLIDATMALYLKDKKIANTHPDYERLGKISERLRKNNPDMIIDKPIIHLSQEGLLDAYSMANHIVFSVKSLELWTDDEMAFIIAHEISHHLLDHHIENMSWMILEGLLTLVLFLAAQQKILFAFAWILLKPVKLFVTYPISRRMEFEADDVGFKMMTRASFDQRQALRFWDKLEILNPSIQGLQYLKGHPNHDERKSRMSKSIKFRMDKNINK